MPDAFAAALSELVQTRGDEYVKKIDEPDFQEWVAQEINRIIERNARKEPVSG